MAQPITEDLHNPAAHWRYAVAYGHTVLGYHDWVEAKRMDALRDAVQEYRMFKSEWDFDDVNIDWADHDEREVDYLKAIRDAAEELV